MHRFTFKLDFIKINFILIPKITDIHYLVGYYFKQVTTNDAYFIIKIKFEFSSKIQTSVIINAS